MKLWMLILCCWPMVCSALTVDELRTLAGQAAQTQREKVGHFSHGDLRDLVNSPTIPNTPKPVTRHAPKKKAPITTSAVKIVKVRSQPPKTLKPTPPTDDEYYPPPRQVNTAMNLTTDAVVVKDKTYRIAMGTWIEGELTRGVNNLENVQVVIRTTEPIAGKRKILPTGTLFFADKVYNPGTNRLEVRIYKGVTPVGDELVMLATVYDLARHAGLTGLVQEKNVEVPGFKKGLLAGGRQIMSDAMPDNPAGTVASTTASTVFSYRGQRIERELSTEYMITVSPQPVLIRVEQSF